MSSTYLAEKARYQRRYDDEAQGEGNGRGEELRTTPLLSLRVRDAVDNGTDRNEENGPETSSSVPSRSVVFPQYGLLGFHAGADEAIGHREPILLNTNAPNSTFICGQQGSGKSYTMSCMLENCLLQDADISKVGNNLAGVVFHYDVDAAGSVAEAASLCSRGMKVNVLVSRSNWTQLKEAYKAVPGAEENGLTVSPLLFQDQHFTVQRMLKLMAFSEETGNVPLYMSTVINVLRKMAVSGSTFSFDRLDRALNEHNFAPGQKNMLDMRMSLLKSFSASDAQKTWDATSKSERRKTAPVHGADRSVGHFELTPGTLTIVDLSDPFVDPSTVCQLFDICLSLIKTHRGNSGVVVALDEAHKYLNKTGSAADFTESLLTTIREQRHNATRVIISTQEPTISERLLDLCSVSIVHHFKSPDWFNALKGHLGAASNLTASEGEQHEMFRRIVELQTGESLVFTPEAFVLMKGDKPARLGNGVLKMKTRKRSGADAGKSVLASGRSEGESISSPGESGSDD